MKAAVLNAFGEPLVIETVPDPVLGTGEIIVDVAAAGVISYAADVFNGSRNYLFDTPVVPGPGGVGRVRAIGPDSTRLRVAIGSSATPQFGRAMTSPIPSRFC